MFRKFHTAVLFLFFIIAVFSNPGQIIHAADICPTFNVVPTSDNSSGPFTATLGGCPGGKVLNYVVIDTETQTVFAGDRITVKADGTYTITFGNFIEPDQNIDFTGGVQFVVVLLDPEDTSNTQASNPFTVTGLGTPDCGDVTAPNYNACPERCGSGGGGAIRVSTNPDVWKCPDVLPTQLPPATCSISTPLTTRNSSGTHQASFSVSLFGLRYQPGSYYISSNRSGLIGTGIRHGTIVIPANAPTTLAPDSRIDYAVDFPGMNIALGQTETRTFFVESRNCASAIVGSCGNVSGCVVDATFSAQDPMITGTPLISPPDSFLTPSPTPGGSGGDPYKVSTTCNGKPGIATAIGCFPTDLGELIKFIIGFAIGIAGGIAFLLIIFGGLRILGSGSNPEALNEGKEIVASAISGLLLIIFSVFILRFIGVDILCIPGFGQC